MTNQNPEQQARDHIDQQLLAAGWIVQDKKKLNLTAGPGIAVREHQTAAGPADYILFVGKNPVGVIEAKRKEEGERLSVHEEQSTEYATAKLKYYSNEPLPFVYESTGELTHFTDYRDPKPRAREVFTFHRPETFEFKEEHSLRFRLKNRIPTLGNPSDEEVDKIAKYSHLRNCQFKAIVRLEQSFAEARPRALIQMATGSGKTYTAITFIYRLLKFAKAGRILFLVDTKNLGEQAEQEFMSYLPADDNRKFTELYGVTRLKSSFIPKDNKVYISTIQRMYSILKGTELDESAEELNPNEFRQDKKAVQVAYNERVPIELFDFIVIDECHRSIYNLWKQVLDYFDAFQIGLTATPDNRTFGYFKENLVSDYGYEKAVIDGVLVPYNVFEITTKVTRHGSHIEMGEKVDKRERLTRRKFWDAIDEEVDYTGKQLDKDVVNPSQIRLIIRSIKDHLPAIFPDRLDQQGVFEVPKTLIFAKSDSHAEDIIEIVREEFGEENKFCKKITYRSDEDPKTVLSQFRNEYYPRIAVTVDMIATGTDIRPLEILVFMRDVKSRSYYEQMKGRGTRTCSLEELKSTGTPSARYTKDHFVIIDAIGVENSLKTDSRPLEKEPRLSIKDLLENVARGNTHEDIVTSLANRLIRLDRQLNEREKMAFAQQADGRSINQVVGQLLNAYDPDTMESVVLETSRAMIGQAPIQIDEAIRVKKEALVESAVAIFHNPDLRNFIIDIRKKYDQIIDTINLDEITSAGWVKDNESKAAVTIQNFADWIEANKEEITALQIFYDQPYRRRELTYGMIKDLCELIKQQQPMLSPLHVWQAYEQLKQATGSPKNELIALVSLIRRVSGIDASLTLYDKTVDQNFKDWVFKKQAGGGLKFTEEQMQWLRMIKDYIANSFHVDKEDFDLDPFNRNGGLGKMWQLFGERTDEIISELNEALVA